jgi:hypothetical protein
MPALRKTLAEIARPPGLEHEPQYHAAYSLGKLVQYPRGEGPAEEWRYQLPELLSGLAITSKQARF